MHNNFNNISLSVHERHMRGSNENQQINKTCLITKTEAKQTTSKNRIYLFHIHFTIVGIKHVIHPLPCLLLDVCISHNSPCMYSILTAITFQSIPCDYMYMIRDWGTKFCTFGLNGKHGSPIRSCFLCISFKRFPWIFCVRDQQKHRPWQWTPTTTIQPTGISKPAIWNPWIQKSWIAGNGGKAIKTNESYD